MNSSSHRPMWQHQSRAVKTISKNEATYLAWEMGVGKTRPVIEYIRKHYPSVVLIVCPKSVAEVWCDELTKWCSDSATHASITTKTLVLNKGTTSKRATLLSEQHAIWCKSPVPMVCIVNYDAVWRGQLGKTIASIKWDLMVCDEAHRIKSPRGVASRYLSQIGSKCGRRVALSGTPMPHSPLDLYGQMRWLSPKLFGYSNTIFKKRYAVMGGYQRNGRAVQVVGFKNMDELNRKFYTVANRIKKIEVLHDLPERVSEKRLFDLTPNVRRVYKRIESGLSVEVSKGTVNASNALVKTLRLQQITGGSIVTHDGNVEAFPSNAKAEALAEVLGDISINDPVVVFCRFRYDIKECLRVARLSGRKSFEMSGEAAEVNDWKADVKIPRIGDKRNGSVIVVQIQSGGLGIDLTLSRYAIYYSQTWSLGDYDQSAARIHRPGQTRAVTYVHLLARDTIDSKIYSAIQQRRNLVETVMEHLKDDKRT